MPRTGTDMSRVFLRDLVSILEKEILRGTHLLQKAGGGEGSNHSVSYSWADPVKLLNLPPPHPL